MNANLDHKNTSTQNPYPRILGAAVVWAAVIIATALKLQGTVYLSQILPIMGGGATSCIILLMGTGREKNRDRV